MAGGFTIDENKIEKFKEFIMKKFSKIQKNLNKTNTLFFDSKISPFILGSYLDNASLSILIKSIRKILKQAINSGGTSMRNYVSTDGTLGNFQNKFKVYKKEGQKISKFKIIRVKQSGRATFYCPELQKNRFNLK